MVRDGGHRSEARGVLHGPGHPEHGREPDHRIIGTAVLLFGILALPANFPTGLAVALLVVVIGMSLGGPTGYAINPARDLGPRIMHFILPIPGKGDSDWTYSWIPVVGPIIGGVIGALLAKAAFGL